MINSIYDETENKMEKSLVSFDNELKRVRTGRASLSLLDSVKVDYYGTPTPLNQMSSVSIPESRLINVQPWDATLIKNIEKAILKANLGLTPSNDGKLIRISVPPLTQERRKEIVKMAQKLMEKYKVAVRNIRRDSVDNLKSLKKDSDISEDEMFGAQDEVQKITDKFIGKIDQQYKIKEKEILEF